MGADISQGRAFDECMDDNWGQLRGGARPGHGGSCLLRWLRLWLKRNSFEVDQIISRQYTTTILVTISYWCACSTMVSSRAAGFGS